MRARACVLVAVAAVASLLVPAAAWAGSADCETTTTTTAPTDPNAPCDAVQNIYSATDTIAPGLVGLGGGVVVLFLVGWGVYAVIGVVRARRV